MKINVGARLSLNMLTQTSSASKQTFLHHTFYRESNTIIKLCKIFGIDSNTNNGSFTYGYNFIMLHVIKLNMRWIKFLKKSHKYFKMSNIL